MCFSSPRMPPVAPAPNARGAAAAVNAARARAAMAEGTRGSVFTSLLGDPSYGKAAKSVVTVGSKQ